MRISGWMGLFLWGALCAACADPVPGVMPVDGPLGCDWTDRDVYRDVPTGAELDEFAPGTLLAAQYIGPVDAWTLSVKAGAGGDFGAEVYRAIYVSELDGEKTVVTARLAFPAGVAATGLVAHQHGTFGFGDACAPSQGSGFGFESELNPLAAWAVTQRRAVVMTDGPGLGTPGPHAYVVKADSGRAVLDGVLAAQAFCDAGRGIEPLGAGPVYLEGHSQGAHATVAALSETAHHARFDEIDIRGATALALPTRHGDLVQRMLSDEDVEPALVAMGILGQVHAHPESFGGYDRWFVPEVVDWLDDGGAEACAPEMSLRFQRAPEDLFLAGVLDDIAEGDFANLGIEQALIAEQLDDVRGDVPVLVLHGDADSLIPVAVVQAQSDAWADAGRDNIEVEIVAGADHWVLPSEQRERVFAHFDQTR